jgi:MFS superfamily sulfate permease-like transporter
MSDARPNGNGTWVLTLVGGVVVGVLLAIFQSFLTLVQRQAATETKVEQLQESVRELQTDAKKERQSVAGALEEIRLQLASGRR